MSNIKLQIREYMPGDRKALIRFMEELQDYLVAIDPMKRMRRLPKYGGVYTKNLLKETKAKNGKIFIATNHGVPIGCVAGEIEKQTKANLLECVETKAGVVLELYVENGYRKQGVGKKLFQKMENYLKDKQCTVIRIKVYENNTEAKKFYKKLGYVNRFVDVLKKIK